MQKVGFTISALVGLAALTGCGGTEDPGRTTNEATGPTYYKDIAPLVNAECASCHQEGAIGGFSLTDADVAAEMAPAIAAAVKARTMPPMPVNNDGSCNTFKNARWLSDEQIALFESWSQAGAPLGDPADAPPPPAHQVPTLSGDIVEFDIGVDYTPKPSDDKPDDYRCFIIDPGIDADAFMTGYDIQPGDRQVVHHVVLFSLADANAEAEADAMDAAEDGPGYTCFGGSGVKGSSIIAAWAPGSGATFLPEGTGIHYGAGRKLVLQMHYNVPAMGGPFTDRSKVKLALAKDPALTPAFLLPTGAFELALPPGQERTEAKGEIPLAWFAQQFNLPNFNGLRVFGALPHMHLAGRTLRSFAKSSAGEQCLTDVDRWDFHWQDLWWNETPQEVSADSSIGITCAYDTRGRTETTVFGEGTGDEMCINVLYATAY